MGIDAKKHKAKKGVSYLVTVVLMTLIAVALSTLLYAYFSGWIGEKTGVSGPVGALSVDAAYANTSSNKITFNLYVRNSGTGNVTINKALVTAPNGTVIEVAPSGDTTIAPGNTGKIRIDVTSSSKGLWTIKLLGDDGSAATVNVRVS